MCAGHAADTPRPIPATRPRQETPAPPTVLMFRDGHQAEIHKYADVGQTLWIFSEERARKVPLADLDLGATRNANDARRGACGAGHYPLAHIPTVPPIRAGSWTKHLSGLGIVRCRPSYF